MPVRGPYLRLVLDTAVAVHEGARQDLTGKSTDQHFDADNLASCLCAVAVHQDRRAFRVLFDHFAPRIRSYGGKLGCNAAEAEELVQDTMVKVWRKAKLYDPACAAPSTWIYRIARNQRIDNFRRESHPEFDPNDPCLVPDAETPADEVMEQREADIQLHDNLNTLPEEQRLLLHMSFFQDMPHSQIAAELDIPLGTVKSRLRLAMGKLRTRLGDRAAGPAKEPTT